jgi:carboxypeptidase Taq
MQVCRGLEFLSWAAPAIRAAFPDQVRAAPLAYTADNLYRCYTRVSRSFIRVDADEVTYPAHVLLRYDIERKLIAGELSVLDLPHAWDSAMQELLGLSTKGNDSDGCMQDVHWPCGLFGYFPMYTLGAMVAAQLFAAMTRQHPDIPSQIARGEFEQLNDWLRSAIWSRGRSCSLTQMLIDATGEGLNATHFRQHLVARYAS